MAELSKIPPLAKWLAALMSLTLMGLGVIYIWHGYVPAKWNKHGYVHAMYNHDARVFGAMMIILGLMPLLFFSKNAKQASILGALWGFTFLICLFSSIYVH